MSLRRRLAKLEVEIGPVSAKTTYDLRLLHPQQVDFICQFMFRPSGDQEFIDNIPAIDALLRRCAVEPIDGLRVILPKFPHGLQVYWRHQRFVNDDFELPPGNYDFRTLTYAAQAQFQYLCQQYGWNPSANEIEINPLSQWAEEDLSELYDLLDWAVPETEKSIRQRCSGK